MTRDFAFLTLENGQTVNWILSGQLGLVQGLPCPLLVLFLLLLEFLWCDLLGTVVGLDFLSIANALTRKERILPDLFHLLIDLLPLLRVLLTELSHLETGDRRSCQERTCFFHMILS